MQCVSGLGNHAGVNAQFNSIFLLLKYAKQRYCMSSGQVESLVNIDIFLNNTGVNAKSNPCNNAYLVQYLIDFLCNSILYFHY